MDVTLLYFDGCPNWRTAEQRLVEALERLGRRDVAVARRKVTSREEAHDVGFTGSPTVLVDGRDPFADPRGPVGLACRLYATRDGAQGAPSVDDLVAVLGG